MNANKRIAVNSVVIFIRLCIVSLVSLICSRVVLDALGESDYGLYNVVGGIVTLLNVINTSMVSTTYRFIAFELGRKADGELNKVFSTSFTIHAFFSLFIIVAGLTLGDWYIYNYLNVAEGKLGDALFVFHISLATTAISTLLVPFQGTLVAYERFSVIAVVDILSNVAKLAAILLLIYGDGNRLRTYSIIIFACSVLGSAAYYVYCHFSFRRVISLRLRIDKPKLKEMADFAVWTLFGACASMGKVQGSALIINLFFGTVVNAAFAVANQVENFILMFARTLNNAAIPQITKSFSGGDSNRSILLTSYISKYTFILMCMVAFPTMLEMEFLLGLWLKKIPEGAPTFCRLIILGGLLDCLGAGIPALVNATGKIRNYQIIVHTYTLLGLPIAFVLYMMGSSPYAISVVYCVIIGTCSVVRLYLLRRIYNFDISVILQKSYIRIFYISIPLLVFYLLYSPDKFSFAGHVAGFASSEVFLLAIVAILGLDSVERTKVRQYLSRANRNIK